MSFFLEAAGAAGLNELRLARGYSVINYNGEAVYIEGALKLLTVEAELIRIELRGAIVSVAGTTLSIFELSDCVIIKGQIGTMEFIPCHNKKKTRKRSSL